MRPIDDAIRQAVVADYSAGLSSTLTAEKHGVSETSVLVWVRAAKVAVRSKGGKARGTLDYTGGWRQTSGGILRPLSPRRNRPNQPSVRLATGVPAWENWGRTKDGPGPAALTAGGSQGLANAIEER